VSINNNYIHTVIDFSMCDLFTDTEALCDVPRLQNTRTPD